jgi:hypothetical protein
MLKSKYLFNLDPILEMFGDNQYSFGCGLFYGVRPSQEEFLDSAASNAGFRIITSDFVLAEEVLHDRRRSQKANR